MEITIETVIGFLTGTVATIVLKGVVEYFQKRIEFKRGLQGAIHAKKLDAAENAIKALFQSYQSILVIITAIDNLLNKDMDEELFEQIWENYFKHIERGESDLLASSASLYFNLEDDKLWSFEDQRLLFESYSNIKILGDEINAFEKEIESIENEDQKEKLENYVDTELLGSSKEEFKKLGVLLKKNSNAIFYTIQKIKSEFQK